MNNTCWTSIRTLMILLGLAACASLAQVPPTGAGQAQGRAAAPTLAPTGFQTGSNAWFALQQASSAAVSALLKVMVDPSTPASARVRAADCILARGNQGLENEDHEVRLAALERAAELAKVPTPY